MSDRKRLDDLIVRLDDAALDEPVCREFGTQIAAAVNSERAAKIGPEKVVASEDLISDHELLRTECYNDSLRKYDLFYVVAALFPVAERQIGILGVHRPFGSKPHDEGDKSRVGGRPASPRRAISRVSSQAHVRSVAPPRRRRFARQVLLLLGALAAAVPSPLAFQPFLDRGSPALADDDITGRRSVLTQKEQFVLFLRERRGHGGMRRRRGVPPGTASDFDIEALESTMDAAYARTKPSKGNVDPRAMGPLGQPGPQPWGEAIAVDVVRSFSPQSFLAQVGCGRSTCNYRKDQIVYSQGDHPGNTVFFILKGKVKVTVVSKQGKEAVIAMLGAGDFFGERCLAGLSRRQATITTTTDSVIMRLEKAAILRLIQDEPAFSEMFISHLLTRNIRLEDDLVDHLFNSSERRLARLLVLLANTGKEEEPEPVVPKISQEMLAGMIGTTRSRVSVFMNKFRKLGFVDYNKGGMTVHRSLLNFIQYDQPE
jgi:CRP-like cAMP-binding protein